MSIMSCYYQPVSEEVKGLPITCHTGTESESWYSPSQTLTLELEGGGGYSRPCPSDNIYSRRNRLSKILNFSTFTKTAKFDSIIHLTSFDVN